MQKDEKGEFVPIEFMSKLWTESEFHWPITTKELAAMIEAIKKWQKYLSYKKFYVHADAKNVHWLMNKIERRENKSNPMHYRWVMKLKDEQYECIHIPGVENLVSDYSSRYNDFEGLAKQMADANECYETEQSQTANMEQHVVNMKHNNHSERITDTKPIQVINENVSDSLAQVKIGKEQQLMLKQQLFCVRNLGGGKDLHSKISNPKQKEHFRIMMEHMNIHDQYAQNLDNRHLYHLEHDRHHNNDTMTINVERLLAYKTNDKQEDDSSSESSSSDSEDIEMKENSNIRRSQRLRNERAGRKANKAEQLDWDRIEEIDSLESDVEIDSDDEFIEIDDIDLEIHYEYELLSDNTDVEFMFDKTKLLSNQKKDPLLAIV